MNVIFCVQALLIPSILILILCLNNNLSNSLKLLSEEKKNINKDVYKIVYDLLSGYLLNLSVGQFYDIKNSSSITVENLIHKKTSTLFEYCYIMPWIFHNCEKSTEEIIEKINNMKNFSQDFGTIFQIADDFEDEEQDYKNKDGKKSITNY